MTLTRFMQEYADEIEMSGFHLSNISNAELVRVCASVAISDPEIGANMLRDALTITDRTEIALRIVGAIGNAIASTL